MTGGVEVLLKRLLIADCQMTDRTRRDSEHKVGKRVGDGKESCLHRGQTIRQFQEPARQARRNRSTPSLVGENDSQSTLEN